MTDTMTDTVTDTVKGLRKALKKVTGLMDATDARAYVRVVHDKSEDEFLLTGKVTVDVNGYVVIHAE